MYTQFLNLSAHKDHRLGTVRVVFPEVHGLCCSFAVTLCEWVWKLHLRVKIRDSVPDLPVSVLAVLNLQRDSPSSMGLVGGHRIIRSRGTCMWCYPRAIYRWDVAFKLLFKEPSNRIFGFAVWLLDDAQILKSKSHFWLYRNDPENILWC